MRLNRFLTEEGAVQAALDIKEPEVDGKYSERVIKDNKDKIEKAISKLGEPKDEAEEAILADLEDKLEKWGNIDKETKPAGPGEPPPEGEEGDAPPEDGEEKNPPEDKEEEPPEDKEEDPPEDKEEDEEDPDKKKKEEK